jgi:hypothetical protein
MGKGMVRLYPHPMGMGAIGSPDLAPPRFTTSGNGVAQSGLQACGEEELYTTAGTTRLCPTAGEGWRRWGEAGEGRCSLIALVGGRGDGI